MDTSETTTAANGKSRSEGVQKIKDAIAISLSLDPSNGFERMKKRLKSLSTRTNC